MSDPSIPHRIERTRNRHSRALLDGSTVVIRLARGLTSHEEQEHIDYLLKRMQKVALKELERTPIDPFKPLFEGQSSVIVTLGNGKQWRFDLVPGSRTTSKRIPEGWTVTVAPGIRRTSLHRYLWNLLAHLEYERMEGLLTEIDMRTLDVGFKSFRLRYTTSQWGSCSARGDILIGTQLLLVPDPLLEYVMVHELAHRLHRNHSRRYWAAVERVLPAYKELRNELKKYRVCPL